MNAEQMTAEQMTATKKHYEQMWKAKEATHSPRADPINCCYRARFLYRDYDYKSGRWFDILPNNYPNSISNPSLTSTYYIYPFGYTPWTAEPIKKGSGMTRAHTYRNVKRALLKLRKARDALKK